MNKSAYSSEYVIPPPDFPDFVFKRYVQPLEELIDWARKEYQARLIHCAEKGYWRTLKYLNEEYSPYRILAELHGFRKYCSYLNQNPQWAGAKKSTQRFIVKSYQLRDMLFRQNGVSKVQDESVPNFQDLLRSKIGNQFINGFAFSQIKLLSIRRFTVSRKRRLNGLGYFPFLTKFINTVQFSLPIHPDGIAPGDVSEHTIPPQKQMSCSGMA